VTARFVQYAVVRADSPIHSRDHSIVGQLLQPGASARLLARNQNSATLCKVAAVPVYLGIGPREYFAGPLRLPEDFRWESELSASGVQWLKWAGVTHLLAFDPMTDPSLELVWAGYDPLLHGVLGRPATQPLWLYAVHGTRGRVYWAPTEQSELLLGTATETPVSVSSAEITAEAANYVEIALECDQPAVIVLTELMYPGWKVFVDDHPSSAVPGSVFRAVQVDQGRHTVRWVYRPLSQLVGALISILGLAGTCAFLWCWE